MNSKRVNSFFLTTIVLHVLFVALVVVFRYTLNFTFRMGIATNLVVSSAMVTLPAILFLFISGEKNIWHFLGFRKIRISSCFSIVLITFLLMPFATLLNAFSMLFVKNAFGQISGSVLKLPIGVTLLLMAVSGPIFEELAFRGLVFQGYRREGNVVQAIGLSAFLFALMHMNFNQAIYAFFVGLIMAVLVEVTGSIWASIIFHCVFNGWNILTLYISQNFIALKDLGDQVTDTSQQYRDGLLYAIGIYSVISVITIPIAGCLIYWLAGNEGRRNMLGYHLKERKKERGKVITIPFIIGVTMSLLYMIMDVILF